MYSVFSGIETSAIEGGRGEKYTTVNQTTFSSALISASLSCDHATFTTGMDLYHLIGATRILHGSPYVFTLSLPPSETNN